MKKLMPTLFLFLLFVFPASAMAQGQAAGGGFKGPDATRQVTVGEALKMADDGQVTLTGKIDKRLEPEKYQFSDATGSITIEIDDELWRGLTVGPDDVVVIHGEIDRDFNRRKIEVKSISKK